MAEADAEGGGVGASVDEEGVALVLGGSVEPKEKDELDTCRFSPPAGEEGDPAAAPKEKLGVPPGRRWKAGGVEAEVKEGVVEGDEEVPKERVGAELGLD
jgi:hypothetical protein